MSNPLDVRAKLIEHAGADLCHVMGTKYSEAVLACLREDIGAHENWKSAFRLDVLGVLEELGTFEIERRRRSATALSEWRW